MSENSTKTVRCQVQVSERWGSPTHRRQHNVALIPHSRFGHRLTECTPSSWDHLAAIATFRYGHAVAFGQPYISLPLTPCTHKEDNRLWEEPQQHSPANQLPRFSGLNDDGNFQPIAPPYETGPSRRRKEMPSVNRAQIVKAR